MIERVAEELGWTKEETEKFYIYLFKLIREETSNPTLPTIHLQDFGKFYSAKIKIDKTIQALIRKVRKGQNVEENKEKIKSLWEARKGKDYKRI